MFHGAAELRAVTNRASSVFTGAIHRYGITAEDIVMEGVVKLLASGTVHGDVLRPELLWWAAHKAGLDMVRASARRAQQVPLWSADGSLRIDPPARDDGARPEHLVWESTCWRLVAHQLHRHLTGVSAADGPRARVGDPSALAAWRLACRAAVDVHARRAFAERPRLAVWAEVRAAASDEFRGGSAERFPPRAEAAARRRAFRLVGRAVSLLAAAHRDVEAQVHDDEREERVS